MPTLLEKPTDPSKAPMAPAVLLRSRHQWERWRGVLFALLIGLAVTLAAVADFRAFVHAPSHAGLLGLIWISGLVLTLAAATIAWRRAPASLADTAQMMDRRLSARNRLEAVAALHGSPSLLAQAQRDETVAYLGNDLRLRPVRTLPWLIAAALIAGLAHFLVLAVWTRPLPAPVVQPPPPPKPVLPQATIVWRSPIPETKANPVEEVPTVAVAESSTGLNNLTLEVSVNGEPKSPVPIPAESYNKPGKNTVKTSIYMDELNAQPFDIVSYYIRGERIAPGEKIPDTTSPIQFIQVRPFREDYTQGPALSKAAKKAEDLLLELKLIQLRSMKENFVLAHTDLPVTDPTRVQANDRVGKDQGMLATKTEEIVQEFIQLGIAAPVIDLLRQAEPPMDDASKKILATKNAAALPPQGKALDYIVQVEKFIIHGVADKPPPGGSPKEEDPFADKQKHDLTKRFQIAAGQLEQLVKNQKKLADDLNQPNPSAQPNSPSDPSAGATPTSPAPGTTDDGSKEVPLPPTQALDPFGPDSGKGSYSERQTRVVQGVEALQTTNKVLPPAVDTAFKDAHDHGMGSLHLLDQHDEVGARQPATTTADDLQRAYTAMINAGDEQAKLAMEQAQQQLNDLGQQMRDLVEKATPGSQSDKLADIANKLHDVEKQLNDAADQQQETGSAEGAQNLNHLANQISNQNIARDLGTLYKNGFDPKLAVSVAQRLEALAGQAAAGQVSAHGDKPTAQDYARMVNALESSRANLEHLAQLAGATGQTPLPGQTGAKSDSKAPGSGQQPGPTPGAMSGQGQGQKPGAQGEAKGQGSNPGSQPGQNPAAKPGESGLAETPSQTPGQGQGQNPSQNPTQDQVTTPGQSSSPTAADGGGIGEGVREVVANIKNQAQQISATVHSVDTTEIQRQVNTLAGSDYQASGAGNVVHAYQALAPPLDKLIAELREQADLAEREDVVKQPDLDEAPAPYRPAVSDYFETLSRDYHPDGTDADETKP